MPLLTSRMEKELIFSSFTLTRPDLCVRSGERSVRIPYDEYLSEVNCITLLKNECFFAGCEVIVSFFYKKAKIFFKTRIERENALFFRIPQDIHVARKKKRKCKFPSMRLYYQNFLLSTFSPSQAGRSKEVKVQRVQEEPSSVKNIFLQSKSMGHDLFYLLNEMKQCLPLGCNLYSHLYIINGFLEEKKKNDVKKRGNGKNLYVFSDSHLILLFSSVNFAMQFAADKLKKFKANIAFKDREINCEVQYGFFSPFERMKAREVEASFGFLGFRIIEIQEEDRRYLYESVFSGRYGEHLIQEGVLCN